MATTPASLEKTLEETVKISATLETGSLPSARRNLEAVFFDLDDSLVLIHAADTVAHKAVQDPMSFVDHGWGRYLTVKNTTEEELQYL
ncbi:unnamed protein product [Sphagnum jensenii]|uniref:Uncharacterized protein n=1 Tax=Sphagnum jensenii TaxID=128206 RepID=A0ABP0WJZ8_9BRYO